MVSGRLFVRTPPVAALFVTALAATAVLSRRFPRLKTPEARFGIVSLELAFTRRRAQAMIASWRSRGLEAAAKRSLLIDLPYIGCYTSALTLSAVLSGRAGAGSGVLSREGAHEATTVLATAAVAAGLCDLLENGGLWLELSGHTGGVTVGATSAISAGKWLLILGSAVGSLTTLLASAKETALF
jgi:hypothetical protein